MQRFGVEALYAARSSCLIGTLGHENLLFSLHELRGGGVWGGFVSPRSLLGLSFVDQIQPLVCYFLPRPRQKITHNNDKEPCCRRRKRCERKSYLFLVVFAGFAGKYHQNRKFLGGSTTLQTSRLAGDRVTRVIRQPPAW